MRLLAVIAFVPSLLCAGEWNTAAPEVKPGSFQWWAKSVVESLPDHQGEPIVAVNPEVVGEEPPCDCECGENCDCVDCDCAGPPPVAPTGPPLKIVVWETRHCPHGERAIREIVPALECARPGRPAWVAGRDYEIVRSDYGQCPQFYWRGVPFSRNGYSGVRVWMIRLRAAMGVASKVRVPARQPSNDRSVHDAHVSPAPGSHSHRCDACGTIWSHDGTGEHFAEHSCPRCGRYQNVIYQGTSAPPAMQQRTRYYGRAAQSRGFFGRMFNRGGCANGNCR